MNKAEQIILTEEITSGIMDRVMKAIHANKIPTEWDGHELRMLIKDIAEEYASVSLIKKNPRTARAKDYKNTVLVNYL